MLNVLLFSFPIKNETLFEAWISAIRRKEFKPSKASKICSEHFTENDYLIRPGTYVRRLKPDAVPSVFPAFPSYLKEKQTSRRILKRKSENTSELSLENAGRKKMFANMPNEENICHDANENIQNKQVDKQIQTEENAIEINLKKKIKSLQQKLRRKEKKITNLQDMLQILREKGLVNEDMENFLKDRFEGTVQKLFVNEMKNAAKIPKAVDTLMK